MTDDQIIIDGCNVLKCRYFLKDNEGQDYNTDEFVKGCCEAKGSCIGYEFAGYGLCRGDKDCYFKQLARKTQECEELKEKQKIIGKAIYKESIELCNENTRYRKALEEIEKVCIKDTREFADGTAVRYDSLDEILDIINKAKGE